MAPRPIPPPEGFKPALKQGRAWCPVCGEETKFRYDGRLDYARCSQCGISERDFYVRQYNRLWADGDLDRFTRSVRSVKTAKTRKRG